MTVKQFDEVELKNGRTCIILDIYDKGAGMDVDFGDDWGYIDGTDIKRVIRSLPDFTPNSDQIAIIE